MRRLLSWRHGVIAVILLALNAWAWLGTAPVAALPEVEPRLAPEIAELREKLWSGEHKGESFAITFTDQSASQAVAWFLAKRPEIPFSHPQVQFTRQGIDGRGIIHLLGMRTEVNGLVRIWLSDGLPVIDIRELGVAGANAPIFIIDTVSSELNKQVNAVNRMPMTITRLELQEGALVLEGIFK
jgi:hypothetical protein